MYTTKDEKKRYSKNIFSAAKLNTYHQKQNFSYPEVSNRSVKSNMNLVYSCAERFLDNGLTYFELIKVGSNGLIKALDSFDETTQRDFIAYAKAHIKQSIIKAIAENERSKPIPLNKIGLLSENFNRIKKDNSPMKYSSFKAVSY